MKKLGRLYKDISCQKSKGTIVKIIRGLFEERIYFKVIKSKVNQKGNIYNLDEDIFNKNFIPYEGTNN